MLTATRVMRCLLILFVSITLAGVTAANAKQPEGKGSKGNKGYSDSNGKGDSGRGGQGNDINAGAILGGALIMAGISMQDARNIALGQNLTGYSSLPPGIQKNLGRGKPLPPGIAKKMVPNGMLNRLPVHPGYEWRVMGSDLVLISIASAVVADILHDVFR